MGRQRTTAPNEPSAGARDDGEQIAALMQQAERAFQANRLDRLREILDRVLEINPDHVGALYNRGILHRDKNELFGAETCFRRVLALDPDKIDAYQALADLLFNVKQLMPAARFYELALERAPNRLPLLHNLAKARLMLKEVGPTEALSRRILDIDDKSIEALNNLIWALVYRGRDRDIAEALTISDRAVALAPDGRQGLALREALLRLAGRVSEADALWARILDTSLSDWEIAKPYCEAYFWLDRNDRARTIVSALVEANPERSDSLRGLAMLLMGDGDFDEAQAILDRAAELAPGDMSIRMGRGLNAFRLGDFELGLALYDARWHRDKFDKPWDIPVPEWNGEKVDGRILVYSEQGIGDYVMYALLFKELRPFAKSVTIEVNPRIASVFRRSFPDMAVIDRNGLPTNWDPSIYAAKVAMGDLPLRLKCDMENLPHREGFLIAEPNFALKLRERYQALFPNKRLIGISWRSGNRDSATIRSIDLRLMTSVFETPDCAFISLQYGDIARDLDMLKAETGHEIYWDKEVDPMNFVDPFTAQVAAMDLVISVDNSTVHFAGALGVPCWVMLPVNSDWRWLTERSTSIWYESLTLFRQQRGDGWERVVATIAGNLRTTPVDTLTDAQGRMCLRNGEEMLRRDDVVTAEGYFRWLLTIGRHTAVAVHGIGLVALKARKFADAAGILGRAVELAPERLDYRADWATALYDVGHRDAAEKMARDLTRQSSDPAVQMAYGKILAVKGALDQATDYFARVLRADPNHVAARFVLADLQARQGEFDLARRNFTRLIDIAPDLPAPRTALAELDLTLGDNEAAQANFAWRFGAAPEELPRHLVMMAASDRPKSWSGGKIRRRRLFLRAERNFVEQMVFARFLADVARDSRHVLAECDEAALPLLKMAFPDVGFAASGKLAPSDLAAHRVQVAASLGDLSLLYQQTAGAWLPYDPALPAAHRRRYQADTAGRVVGISWRLTGEMLGGLERFEPLFDLPGIRWVTLPTGEVDPALLQSLSSPDERFAFEPGALHKDWQALAGALSALDLVIAGDDGVAVLAGAVGTPVWKIAESVEHWTWRAEGAESPWHPGARIHRDPDLTALRSGLQSYLQPNRRQRGTE